MVVAMITHAVTIIRATTTMATATNIVVGEGNAEVGGVGGRIEAIEAAEEVEEAEEIGASEVGEIGAAEEGEIGVVEEVGEVGARGVAKETPTMQRTHTVHRAGAKLATFPRTRRVRRKAQKQTPLQAQIHQRSGEGHVATPWE